METSPDDSPDSHNDMGRIFIQAKRPVPLCMTPLISGGTLDPVNINSPRLSLRSASNLTASQSCGATCHSSIRRGFAPRRSSKGFNRANSRFCTTLPGSVMYSTLLEICFAVVVLPHHFAPSKSTAPFPCNLRASNRSAIRGLYFSF